MNKLQKRTFLILSSSVVVLIIALIFMYYSLGTGFGNAVVKTTKGVRDAQKEWKEDGVNPLDTIREQIKSIAADSVIIHKNE